MSTIFTGALNVYQGQTCPLYLQGHSMFNKDRQVHYTYRGIPGLARTDMSTIFTGVLHLYQGQTGPLCLQGCSMFTKDRQVHYTYSGYHA